MKLFKNILRLCAAAVIALPVFGCGQDELVKPSALLSESSLTFEAIGSESQQLTIASDDSWFIDVDADWITVDPTSGTNTVKVNVSVEDNVTNGTLNAPREGTLTVANGKGYSIRSVIYQNGDNYFGVSEMPVSEVRELQDGEYAKVAEAQVVALTSDGFVATDESASIYVSYKDDVALGDKVFIAGEKVTLYGGAALVAGEITVKSNSEVKHPEAVDLLSNLDPSKAGTVTYVSVSAGLLGHDLKFAQSLPVSVAILDSRNIDITEVNMHNISVRAYTLGLDEGVLTLAVTEVQDNGINDELKAYFYDDFSWMKSYIDASEVKVGDSIGENSAGAEAPNLRSNDALKPLLNALLEKGYEDLNPDKKVIYAQKYYWKLGRSSSATENNNNGLKLPKQKFKGDELINVDIEFDWAAHMTGSGNIDKVQIVVELEGAGTFDNGTKISDPFVTTQEKGHIEWQHASVTAKGVNNTTRIIIRPAEYASVVPDQQRWHIDNIKIKDSAIPYSDPVYAKVKVSDEVVTFEGTPVDSYKLTIQSDNPWTLVKDADWFSVDVTEGEANEETTVTVTCEPSNMTTLRHSVLTVVSADTRKNIHIVQSAAGGELDPLISISSGNSVEVLGQGAEFTAMVQANVAFETEIKDSWISEVEVPATRSMVETTVKTFKAEPNLTSADRVGTIRFYKGNLESVLTVKQTKFEPKVVMTINKLSALPAEATKVAVHIEANVDTKVSSDVITLPANELKAGKYDFEVTVPANSGSFRNVKVVFENDEYSYKYTYSVLQLGSAMTTMFFDDFGWLQQYVDAYNATAAEDKKVGDTIGKNNKSAEAPNIYGKADWQKSLLAELATKGYEDMCSSEKVVYLQPQYLKFGRTKGHNTSIRLPKLDIAGTTDIVTDFDWAAMAQGDGTIDDTKLVVVIEGDGLFDNGTKYSDLIVNDQPKDKMYWTHSAVKINGASSNTRLVIVMYRVLKKDAAGNYTGEYNYNVGGAGRFFLDNIRISK